MSPNDPKRVLVVDDNRELAENVAEILQGEGYLADVEHDPSEALRRAADRPFDIAVLDVRLPGMDGVTLFKKLLLLQPSATYVLMTAFTTDERIAEALAAGARAVLPKPVPVGELFDLLPPPDEGMDPVVIVEDDEQLAEGLREVLAERGYPVEIGRTLEEGRSRLRSTRIAAAIVDVRLPDGDGCELARELCNLGAPVVLITGYEPTEMVEAVRTSCAGNCQVLTKPFAPDALLRALRELRSRTAVT